MPAGVACLSWVTSTPFYLSSSYDTTVSLWHRSGALVGSLGRDRWVLEDRDTWRAAFPAGLDLHDEELLKGPKVKYVGPQA